jgi:predicted Zn-ribbon and HTH transcriptional regulator
MIKGPIKIPTLTCKQCGHQWVPTVPEPRCCPRCKSYKYMETKDLPKEPVEAEK